MEQIGRVFVYGTLMQGMENHSLLAPYVKTLFPATLQGRLAHLTQEGYPMLFSGIETVQGELVDLTDEAAALALLDPLEGFIGPGEPQNLYERCQLMATDRQGKAMEAWVYICPPAAESRWWATGEPVANGDWRAFFVDRKKLRKHFTCV